MLAGKSAILERLARLARLLARLAAAIRNVRGSATNLVRHARLRNATRPDHIANVSSLALRPAIGCLVRSVVRKCFVVVISVSYFLLLQHQSDVLSRYNDFISLLWVSLVCEFGVSNLSK
jgi:hypothetical protein